MGIPFKPSPNVLAYAQININKAQSVNVSSMVLQSVQSGEWSEYSFIFQGKDERNCTASDCDGRVVG